jgi:ribonuclease HI
LLSRKEVSIRLKIISILKFAITKLSSVDDVIRILEGDVGGLLEQSRSGYKELNKKESNEEEPIHRFSHVLRFDGSANNELMNGGFGFSINFEGNEIDCDAGPMGLANVNQAEVTALEFGLRRALFLGIKKISVIGDSKFAVKIGTAGIACPNPKYILPFLRVQEMIKQFDEYEIIFAPRKFNSRADVLAFTGCNAPDMIEAAKRDVSFTRPINSQLIPHRFSVLVPNGLCQRYFQIKNPLDKKWLPNYVCYPPLQL